MGFHMVSPLATLVLRSDLPARTPYAHRFLPVTMSGRHVCDLLFQMLCRVILNCDSGGPHVPNPGPRRLDLCLSVPAKSDLCHCSTVDFVACLWTVSCSSAVAAIDFWQLISRNLLLCCEHSTQQIDLLAGR